MRAGFATPTPSTDCPEESHEHFQHHPQQDLPIKPSRRAGRVGARCRASGGCSADGRARRCHARRCAGRAVDVEAVLTALADQNSEKLNWRTSIVDLMKLLGLDSSLAARKQLAEELHYSGDTSDSASMNIWLHKQVMTKLAENGGKVPDDLKN